MKNLGKFFHYHEGETKWQCVKIGGSFMAAVSLLIMAGALQAQAPFEERSALLSLLVPEPIVPALAEETAAVAPVSAVPAPAAAPLVATPSPSAGAPKMTAEIDPAKLSSGQPVEQQCFINERPVPCDELSKLNEEEDRRNVLEERKGTLREIKDQKRELTRVCKQLTRLKGAETDVAACADLVAKVVEFERKLKTMDASDPDELRQVNSEYRELNVWDDLNTLRFKANLPNELNNFIKDLTRLEKVLKQKRFQKITGLNYEAVNAKVAEIKALHAESKACYAAGDFDCANEKLNEARESNYPGDLEGPLHMLSSIFENLRHVKNEEVKSEVIALVQPSIDQLNSGEWRGTSQELEPLNRELSPFLEHLSRTQSRQRSLSTDSERRLRKLMEKFGGSADQSDEREE